MIERLWPAVQAAGLDADLGITEEASADLEAVVEQVNHYLMHLAEHAIADGLHVLGEVVADGGRAGDTPLDPALLTQRMAAYLAQLVRLPNGDIPSLHESILEAWGTTLTTAHQHGTQPVVSDRRRGCCCWRRRRSGWICRERRPHGCSTAESSDASTSLALGRGTNGEVRPTA